jgi:hypothetical protein
MYRGSELILEEDKFSTLSQGALNPAKGAFRGRKGAPIKQGESHYGTQRAVEHLSLSLSFSACVD